MKRRHYFLLVVFLVIAILLAPYVQKTLHYLIIEPAAYYWWGIKQVARVIPQSLYWIIILTSLSFVSIFSLIRDLFLHKSKTEMILTRKGPVQALADNIVRSENRDYFRWAIANRLANIARRILFPREQLPDENQPALDSIKWDAPPEVRKYLETGLQSSFMGVHGYRKRFRKQKTIPLDINLNQVITYIESKMETEK